MSECTHQTRTRDQIADSCLNKIVLVGVTMARATIIKRLLDCWACTNTQGMLDAEKDLHATIVQPESLKQRINRAAEEGEDAFWEAVAKNFPETKSGDLDPWECMMFSRKLEEIITMWLQANTDLLPDVGEEVDNDNLQ